jgi:hypothetical protein
VQTSGACGSNMTTKKQASTGGGDSKSEPTRQAIREGGRPEEMWARLEDLRVGFERAAASYRSDEMAEMGHILRCLSEAPEFRKTTHASLRSFLERVQGIRPGTRREEERILLAGMTAALQMAPDFLGQDDSGESTRGSPTYRKAVVDMVSLTILGLLPSCPELYGRTTCPPLPATVDLDILAWDDRPKDRETLERLKGAVADKLFDPHSVDPEALVKSAMRALGVEAKYVKHMFRG